MDYIENKINNADLIQTFTSRASKIHNEWTRNTNSTPNKQTPQATDNYQVITDKQVFINNLNDLKANAELIPPELDMQSFLKSLENVENKSNFLEHLSTRKDAQARLAYLNLVEPTLKRPDIKLTFSTDKKEYIKSFKDGDNNLWYLLVTKDNDKTLITGIPNTNERYIKSEINKADIIHSFIPQNRQTTEVVNGLQHNSTPNKQTTQAINKDLELTQITPELQHKISQKQTELEKTQEKLAIQTTPKGKNYFTARINSLQQEIKDLEIQAGIRVKDDIKTPSNIKELATNKYALYNLFSVL